MRWRGSQWKGLRGATWNHKKSTSQNSFGSSKTNNRLRCLFVFAHHLRLSLHNKSHPLNFSIYITVDTHKDSLSMQSNNLNYLNCVVCFSSASLTVCLQQCPMTDKRTVSTPPNYWLSLSPLNFVVFFAIITAFLLSALAINQSIFCCYCINFCSSPPEAVNSIMKVINRYYQSVWHSQCLTATDTPKLASAVTKCGQQASNS